MSRSRDLLVAIHDVLETTAMTARGLGAVPEGGGHCLDRLRHVGTSDFRIGVGNHAVLMQLCLRRVSDIDPDADDGDLGHVDCALSLSVGALLDARDSITLGAALIALGAIVTQIDGLEGTVSWPRRIPVTAAGG